MGEVRKVCVEGEEAISVEMGGASDSRMYSIINDDYYIDATALIDSIFLMINFIFIFKHNIDRSILFVV